MSRGPVARSLEELDDLERQNLEAGTMGEAYLPPSNTMEAINRVAVRPDDSRSNDELAASPAVSEQHTDAKVIAKTMEPKKSQREMLADWLKEQDALLKGMTSERERAISDAEQASRGVDQGRSIINSLAAGGSILAGNKDLAKGYLARAGEMPGQQKSESDRKALAAWVAKQAEGLNDRGRLVQQANKEDADEYGNIQKGIAHAKELQAQAEIKAAEEKYRKEQDERNYQQRERAMGATLGAAARADKEREQAENRKLERDLTSQQTEFRGRQYKRDPAFGPMSETQANRFLDSVGQMNTTASTLEDMKKAMAAWVRNPNPTTKGNVEAAQNMATTSLNVALRQGTMQQPEYLRALKSMGDLFGSDSILGMFSADDPETAGSLALNRVNQTLGMFDNAFSALAKSNKVIEVGGPTGAATQQHQDKEGDEMQLNGKPMVFRGGKWDWK